MDKKKVYAVFMREAYGMLVFALGGSIFYYLGTGSHRALWTSIAVFVLYSIWHFAEYKREEREKKQNAEIDYHKISVCNPVDDFAVPRYVYENGVECKTPVPKNGRVIGYRIGPSLVIAAKVSPASNGWYRADIKPYCQTYGGTLLNHDDVTALRRYWDIVNEMREAIGQTPLPLPYFWYQAEFSIEAAHYREDFNEIDPSYSALILKL
ncbi:MAG: hypothetical protein IJ770_00260 [Alphaproteobacteria bacterium]|nr:hypothetical protein [Alphaproteobacteria bacterium]